MNSKLDTHKQSILRNKMFVVLIDQMTWFVATVTMSALDEISAL